MTAARIVLALLSVVPLTVTALAGVCLYALLDRKGPKTCARL